jgi:hypothetical protein
MPTEPTPTRAAPVIGPVAPGSPVAKADPSRVATTSAAKPAATTTKATSATAASSFVTAVLRGIGAPVTAGNIAFLNAWINREGGGGANNPLNTTLNMPGATSFNSVNVRNYPNMATGVTATIKTLQNGRYADVVGALKAGTASTTAHYAGLGTWSGNGYSNLAGVSTSTPKAGTSGAAQPGVATPHATSQQVKDTVASQYGYLAGFLDNPEIGPILQQAAKEGWDVDRLQGAIYKTAWYQQHASVTRQFDAQTKLDPATQKQQIMAQATDILTQAKRTGIVLDQKALAKLAWTSLRYGWTGQQLTNAILAQGKLDLSGKTPGGALTAADNLKEQAAQYLVPISPATLQKWTKDIQAGNLTQQDFIGYLKEQAKSLFPGMAVAIDSGVTPAHYVDPYKQIASSTLEVPAESVNFMDPKWSKALFQTDPKTGARTSMSLANWQNTLRSDPSYGYDKTEQARSTAADLTTQLGHAFGAL